jgi:hypothetical protein
VKSLTHGKNISVPEITNVSEHGFWLFLKGQEYFLAFENFPWFRHASIDQIVDVELWHITHLYWPKLDVDLSIEIIKRPEKFKLVSK